MKNDIAKLSKAYHDLPLALRKRCRFFVIAFVLTFIVMVAYALVQNYLYHTGGSTVRSADAAMYGVLSVCIVGASAFRTIASLAEAVAAKRN